MQLFAYAVSVCRAALPSVVSGARSNYVTHKGGSIDARELLSEYRDMRAASTSLNYITKRDQLDYIEQDDTYRKFYFSDADSRCTHAHHYGNGSGLGHSEYATGGTVCFFDPAMSNLGDGRYSDALDGSCREEVDIVYSDMAFGDDQGMSSPKIISRLHEQLRGRYPDAWFRVKLDITGDELYRGEPFLKPRPHNHELIVDIEDGADPLLPRFREALVGVLAANERRNRSLACAKLSGKLKPHWMKKWQLGELADRVRNRNNVRPLRSKKYEGRGHRLVRRLKPDKVTSHQKRYAAFCKDPNFVLEGGAFARLPPDRVKPGAAVMHNPCVADPAFSLRSYLRSGVDMGLRCAYLPGGWALL